MPTIDNTGRAGHGTSTSPVTITSFAVGAGSNRLLLVGVSYYTGSGTPTLSVSGVTFNTSSNLSFLDSKRQNYASGQQVIELWYMLAPPNVTADIVVSFTATPQEIVIGADSWSSVHQSSTFGTVAKNNAGVASLPTVNVSSETGSVVHDAVTGGDSTSTLVATGTEAWQDVNTSGGSRGVGQYKTGAASVTMDWGTGPNFLDWWVNMGVSIRDVSFSGAGPATDNKRRSSLSWPLPICVPPCPDGTVD